MKEHNEAMKDICKENIFFVTTNPNNGKIRLRFSLSEIEAGNILLKNVPIRAFVCRDLVFYAIILGKENMSSIW